MRVFVDVGSHEGQTIEEVVKPEWEFDLIFALEPMPRQYRRLWRRFKDNTKVVPSQLALGWSTAPRPMFGRNEELEASLYDTKDDVDEKISTMVEVMDAAEWFEALPKDSDVYVNMNCEGGELAILTRLLDTGAIKRITGALLVDFDIRKVPGLGHFEEDLRQGLDAFGINWISEYPVADTHQEQIAAWLRGVL